MGLETPKVLGIEQCTQIISKDVREGRAEERKWPEGVGGVGGISFTHWDIIHHICSEMRTYQEEKRYFFWNCGIDINGAMH